MEDGLLFTTTVRVSLIRILEKQVGQSDPSNKLLFGFSAILATGIHLAV